MISLREGHSNILIILEISGCLFSKLYIYPITFIPAIQNYDLSPETVTPALSKLTKTISNPWMCSRINLRILKSIRALSYYILNLLIPMLSRKGKHKYKIYSYNILVVIRANWITEFIAFWVHVVIFSNPIGVWNAVKSLFFLLRLIWL